MTYDEILNSPAFAALSPFAREVIARNHAGLPVNPTKLAQALAYVEDEAPQVCEVCGTLTPSGDIQNGQCNACRLDGDCAVCGEEMYCDQDGWHHDHVENDADHQAVEGCDCMCYGHSCGCCD